MRLFNSRSAIFISTMFFPYQSFAQQTEKIENLYLEYDKSQYYREEDEEDMWGDIFIEKGGDGLTETFDFPSSMPPMHLDFPTSSITLPPNTYILAENVFSDREATRIFAGPGDFPPENYGAYAIIAFKSGPLATDLERYIMICDAYRSSIPEAILSIVPEERQLVTVWPVSSDTIAAEINKQNDEEKCSTSANNYGLATALQAIRHARVVDSDLAQDLARNRGPFLLAWSPASMKGQEDALILRLDLSNVDTPNQAKSRMEFWVQQIEMHPERWSNDWQHQTIREIVSELADSFGEEIISFFGGES